MMNICAMKIENGTIWVEEEDQQEQGKEVVGKHKQNIMYMSQLNLFLCLVIKRLITNMWTDYDLSSNLELINMLL